MTISRETELGTVSISDAIFAQLILDAMSREACRGRVWPASRRGKLLSDSSKTLAADYGGYVEASYNADGTAIDLDFPVIIQFGSSIRRTTDALCDAIAAIMREQYGGVPGEMKVRITGIRSRQVARRNVEVIKSYAARG